MKFEGGREQRTSGGGRMPGDKFSEAQPEVENATFERLDTQMFKTHLFFPAILKNTNFLEAKNSF